MVLGEESKKWKCQLVLRVSLVKEPPELWYSLIQWHPSSNPPWNLSQKEAVSIGYCKAEGYLDSSRFSLLKKQNNKKLSMWSQDKLLKRECARFMPVLPSQFLNTPRRRAPRAAIHHRDPGSMALSQRIFTAAVIHRLH